MSRVDQSLSSLIRHSETVLMGIDLSLQEEGTSTSDHKFFYRPWLCGWGRGYLVLLVAVQQRLGSSHVIGQLVSVDQCLHLRHPAAQVPEVCGEALQPVSRVQR